MASVGGNTVNAWSGRLHPARRTIDVMPAPSGRTGNAVAIGAWHSEIDTVRTRTRVADASAAALVNTYRNLIGTLATVVDGYGTSWASTMVVAADCEISSTLEAGYSSVSCVWEFLVIAAAPT